jgi:hypothetical protein
VGALLKFLRGLLCGAGGDATEKKNRRDEHLFPPAATPGFNFLIFFAIRISPGFFRRLVVWLASSREGRLRFLGSCFCDIH